MILSRNIPLRVHTFLNRIHADYQAGLHSSDYRGLLIRETRARYPGLVEGLADMGRGRTRRGEVRVIADADHIIPRSVWNTLIPLVWNLPFPAPTTPHILSNLFWRTVTCNRGAPSRGEALDLPYIMRIRDEQALLASPQWARNHMLMFLRTKHDEGVNIDTPIHPNRVDQMMSGGDIATVLEFIELVRFKKPGILPHELAALVEQRFPHISIETEGSDPRIEIG